jgi:hypothetical protein
MGLFLPRLSIGLQWRVIADSFSYVPQLWQILSFCEENSWTVQKELYDFFFIFQLYISVPLTHCQRNLEQSVRARMFYRIYQIVLLL